MPASVAPQVFVARRQQLMDQMRAGVAVIFTAPEVLRNQDSHYPYRFDSTFYYLTGFTEPEAVLVLVAGATPRSILFCRDKNPARELWDGVRYGVAGAQQTFAMDECYDVAQLDDRMPQILANQPVLFYTLGENYPRDERVMGWLNALKRQVRSGVRAPASIHQVHDLVDEMRLYKSADELTLMQRAADISVAAHRAAMRSVQPGMREYEIEATLLYEFRRQGAAAPAYSPIVASGANACILHYVANQDTLRQGDLLLIDAGCEWQGYAADITRTFPVNGRFSAPQRDLYQLVLAAQAAAIAQIRPGQGWQAPHEAAVAVLAQGFIDLGLCQGSVAGVIERGDYQRFYMHRTGHWLGLDVHDVGSYQQAGEWRLLQPGMVLTVEPGCYVCPAADVPEHFWNIGIRIEDDVQVTVQACEVLTGEAPKTVADIEAWMRA